MLCVRNHDGTVKTVKRNQTIERQNRIIKKNKRKKKKKIIVEQEERCAPVRMKRKGEEKEVA